MWASHFEEPLALAVDPEVTVTGIVAGTVTSNMRL